MNILHNTTLNSLYNVIEGVKMEMYPGEFHFDVVHEDRMSPVGEVSDGFYPDFESHRRNKMPEGYPEWVSDFITKHSIDVFIPYRYRQELSSRKEKFDAIGTRLLTAGDADTMALLENKPRFLQRMDDFSISGTEFTTFTTLSEFDRHWLEMYDGSEPLCIKPSEGIYGAGFCLLHPDYDDMENMMTGNRHKVRLDTYRRLLDNSGSIQTMMLMPFLSGPEASVDFACLDGRILASYTRRKTGRVQIIEHDDLHHDIARRIVEGLGLSGVLNLQTIEDCQGVPRILELNSRTAGGMFKGLATGVNLQLILLRHLSGKIDGANPTARRCVITDISDCIQLGREYPY